MNDHAPALRARQVFWTIPAALKTDAVAVFVFLSLLLIGADRFGLRIGGLSLRAVFPVLMVACSLLYLRYNENIRFHKPMMILFVLWALAGAASSFESYAPAKSVGYTIWTLFNFFIIISLFYNYARNSEPAQVLSLWLFVFRIHCLLVILEFARNILTGNPERPYLWFYEPSYLAIFMTAYFGSALYMLLHRGRAYLPDFLLATATFLLVASATGIFGMLLAVALNFVISRQRLKLLLGTAVLGGSFVGILYVFFQSTTYYQFLVGFLLTSDANLIDLILLRGGNRVVRAIVGWEAFLQHPWLGIGIGADDVYMDLNGFPDAAWRYIRPWSDVDFGAPFCNVFVSVLGSTGILGFLPFMGIILYAGGMALGQIRLRRNPEIVAMLVGFFSILLAMQLDGTVQRYYVWSPLGLALGMVAYQNRRNLASGKETT